VPAVNRCSLLRNSFSTVSAMHENLAFSRAAYDQPGQIMLCGVHARPHNWLAWWCISAQAKNALVDPEFALPARTRAQSVRAGQLPADLVRTDGRSTKCSAQQVARSAKQSVRACEAVARKCVAPCPPRELPRRCCRGGHAAYRSGIGVRRSEGHEPLTP